MKKEMKMFLVFPAPFYGYVAFLTTAAGDDWYNFGVNGMSGYKMQMRLLDDDGIVKKCGMPKLVTSTIPDMIEKYGSVCSIGD